MTIACWKMAIVRNLGTACEPLATISYVYKIYRLYAAVSVTLKDDHRGRHGKILSAKSWFWGPIMRI